jgi:hypothetical protein
MKEEGIKMDLLLFNMLLHDKFQKNVKKGIKFLEKYKNEMKIDIKMLNTVFRYLYKDQKKLNKFIMRYEELNGKTEMMNLLKIKYYLTRKNDFEEAKKIMMEENINFDEMDQEEKEEKEEEEKEEEKEEEGNEKEPNIKEKMSKKEKKNFIKYYIIQYYIKNDMKKEIKEEMEKNEKIPHHKLFEYYLKKKDIEMIEKTIMKLKVIKGETNDFIKIINSHFNYMLNDKYSNIRDFKFIFDFLFRKNKEIFKPGILLNEKKR